MDTELKELQAIVERYKSVDRNQLSELQIQILTYAEQRRNEIRAAIKQAWIDSHR